MRESRWVRVREIKPGKFEIQSKLLQDGLEIDPEELDCLWPQLSPRDRLDLCIAYHAKREITKADERILNIMMERGDEVIWSELASVLTGHRDRDRVLAFLRKRAREQTKFVANYFRTLETLGTWELFLY